MTYTTRREREGGSVVAGNDDQPLGLGDISAPEYLRPTYSNYASVGHTPWDFRITFALVAAPRPGPELDQAMGAGVIEPTGVADIVLPVGVIPGLISALRENYERYLDEYGMPGLGRDASDDS